MQSVTASDSTFDGFTGAWRGEEAAGSKPVAAITRFDLRRVWHHDPIACLTARTESAMASVKEVRSLML